MSFRTTTGTIGIRGTDFLLAVVNPLYFQVLNGVISVTNAAGAPEFGAGAVGTAATNGTLATTIPASALPAGVSQAFSELRALTLASFGPAEPPAAPGVLPAGIGPLVIPAAILIGIGAALSGGDDNGTRSVSGTTGTTGASGTTGPTGTTGTSGTGTF